jgi:hypothetical protein
MKYGYHYTPCDSSCSGPGLWLLLKLSAILGTAAGVWWALTAIGRAMSAAATAAASAAPAVLAVAGVLVAAAAVAVVTFVVRNNQRPPLLPHDRPARQALGASTVEVIDVTPNRKRLNPPRPAYQTFAYQTFAASDHVTASR